MRTGGFSFNLRVGLCLPDVVVFEFATVRIGSLWPCRWGELLKVTFHGYVTCHFVSYFCNLPKSGMSCKKGDAFVAQTQGIVKVTRSRCSYIGICSFRVVR